MQHRVIRHAIINESHEKEESPPLRCVDTRVSVYLRICRSVRLHQSAREHDAHNEKKFKMEFMQPPSTAALRARNRILLRRTT